MPPLANFDDERSIMSQVSGSKPLVITEVGYHADVNTDDPHRGVSEAVNARYTPRTVLEAFRDGIKRTYFYQLADPFTDAQAASKGLGKAESSFGLLRNDLSPRPSFIALRNLLRTAGGSSAAVATPGGLKLGFEGAPGDMRQLLLRSADGTYSLVLWRQVSLWDREAKRPLTPAPDRVDVVMGQPLSLARRFDPVGSDAETGRWANPRRLSVNLAGEPVVLRLTPGSASSPATPGSDPAPAGSSSGLTPQARLRLLAGAGRRGQARGAGQAVCPAPEALGPLTEGARRRAFPPRAGPTGSVIASAANRAAGRAGGPPPLAASRRSR